MRRRDFVSFIGSAAVTWSLAARAQQAVPVIAVLGSGAADAASSTTQMEMLDASMRELGLIKGRDYIFEMRWAGGDSSRFSTLAADLIARRPSVVVVATNLAAIAVQNLSRTVPIVDLSLNAPVATGLVASLAHPGGNITGVSTMADDPLLKLVEIMREVLPGVRNLTVMLNPTNPSNPLMLDMLKRQYAGKNLFIDSVGVRLAGDLDAAFTEMSRQHPGALFVLADNSLVALAEAIVARAMAQRVPTFGTFGTSSLEFLRAGGLLTYGRDSKEGSRAAARLLQKILNGAAPSDLSVEQPTKYKLIINLKTVTALGINIPPSLLARADEVIE